MTVSFQEKDIRYPTRLVLATYTVVPTDQYVFCNGIFTVTLPSAITVIGRPFYIKNVGTGTITVAAIAGTVNFTSIAPGVSIQYMSDGTNWHSM